MKTIASLATYSERYDIVWETVRSLWNQVDEIHIYDNDKELPFPPELAQATYKAKLHIHSAPKGDLKDMGKFYACTLQKKPCIMLTVDDDLIYTSGYAKSMETVVLGYPGIVTHHGKAIDGRFEGYCGNDRMWQYRIACLEENPETRAVDIPGTGCSGFIYHPESSISFMLLLFAYDYAGAADFFLGHWARMEDLPIKALKHNKGFIQYNEKMKDGRPTLWDSEKILLHATKFKRRWPCYTWARDFLYHKQQYNQLINNWQKKYA
jgi:hypothetical protein